MPPRKQSLEREIALRKIIAEMLLLGVIAECQAEYYSQVHLVPKPPDKDGNKKWRLCIDYRALNETIEGMSWPIPYIRSLFQRMGHRRAKYFAVLDLTSGYHQVALSQNICELAAFITPFGTYKPLRISMGLKSAPSYFQKEMATDVLGGLLYSCCEVYIDDIIIYGDTETSFANNLERVLKRLRVKGVTLNPKKAKIGLQSVEVLGHVMDKYGISMSEEKIRKVLDFPPPVLGKELKSFLGLANYFRTHIDHYSLLSHPLEEMVHNYKETKSKRLVWTEETVTAFRTLQERIANCPKLYFMDDSSDIILETDASDYGIGAYLYQVKEDGQQYPIAFMSKSLAGAQ